MILLLGASGLIARAFASEMSARGVSYLAVSRREVNYCDFQALFELVRATQPELVINAAGYVGGPDFARCEDNREEALAANTLLPQTVARVCAMRSITWAHVSSALLYRGAKIRKGEATLVETDLSRPEVRELIEAGAPELTGYSETDEPNFSFVCPPCSFYSGSKALGERAIEGVGQGYVWRAGLLLMDQAHPRNLITRLAHRAVPDIYAPVSHIHDFVCACLHLWDQKAPCETYNVINPGNLNLLRAAGQVVNGNGSPKKRPLDDAPRGDQPIPDCILDASRITRRGIGLDSAERAFSRALSNCRVAPSEKVRVTICNEPTGAKVSVRISSTLT